MKKIFKRKGASVEPQAEPNAAVLIDKMLQQLISLEKKIDILINKPSEKPFERKEHGRPFQRFGGSFRNDRGGRENSFRERTFTKAVCAECNAECEVPFRPTGDRPIYCQDCFSKRKDGASGASARGRTFDKPQGREERGHGGRKPAFRKRSRERS